HTNLDSAEHGVNDVLAQRLGLTDLMPLIAADPARTDGAGMGRIGRYPKAIKGSEFIDRVLGVLDLPSCDVAGSLPLLVQTVALCGGSGSELAEQALLRGADLFLSAEIKHHTARWAEACGFCVIDGTHYATEKPVVEDLVKNLRGAFRQRGWQVSVLETTTENHPFVRMNKTIQDNH
ncbi:MAG: Nif3-like dinuclear metal center hexameric protein, partial [Desulfofustis sp.]|nr:Nif3-like dinuclear metal center hexameric protein [Desulfofustis sp.]